MTRASEQQEVRPFRFLAGDLCLDFVNTVDWTPAGRQHERMPDFGALLKWADSAGLLSHQARADLEQRARANPAEAARAYAAGIDLRNRLQAVWSAMAAGAAPAPDQLAALERAIADAQRHRHLRARDRGRSGPRVEWQWEPSGTDLRRPLWPVVLAAADLLLSDEAGRVRVCSGPDCGWMYVDRSRNGLRRWCAMDTCGAREKARRHYARVRASRRRAGRG